MAELFGIDKSGISRHLAKIFETGELDEEVVVAKIATYDEALLAYAKRNRRFGGV